MVYKVGNIKDVLSIPMLDENAKIKLLEYASILSTEYGADRDLDKSLGGYILYAIKGTDPKEIKAFFDYTDKTPEYVDIYENILTAVYVLSSDYGVVIVMSLSDAPPEILKEINNNTED
jgi:hypothetical protein